METLRRLRPAERIEDYTNHVCDKQSVASLLDALIPVRRDGAIMVVKHHSDALIDTVLREILPEDSAFVFLQSELDVDPINSPMVPPHRLATDDELKYLEDIGIPVKMLPVIRMKDPVRRWHNLPVDSVVAIDRPATNTYFRRVSY